MPPYSESQHKLFEAAAHDASVAKRVGIPQEQASKMASEGIKGKKKDPKKLAMALMKY
jgi:hypothetical protein